MVPDEVETEWPVVEALPERTAVPDEERTVVPALVLRLTGRTALAERAAEVWMAPERTADEWETPLPALRETAPARLVLVVRAPRPDTVPAPPVTRLRGVHTPVSRP